MAKECLIIGRPNTGKTLFMLNFAEFLGVTSLELIISYPGKKLSRRLTVGDARKLLVSPTPHHTRCHQSVRVKFPVGKGKKLVTITDTGGLSEGIHQDAEVRRAMAYTISSIRNAKLILHVLDASSIGSNGSILGISEIDFQIAQFARATKGYIMLVNKIDLPNSDLGVYILKEEFPDVPVIPVSALQKFGFKEVKDYVAKCL